MGGIVGPGVAAGGIGGGGGGGDGLPPGTAHNPLGTPPAARAIGIPLPPFIRRRRELLLRQRVGAVEYDIRRLVTLLEEMLRNQPGINVRQPSHLAIPFNATPLYARAGPTVVAAPASGTDFAVVADLRFPHDGQVTVPPGYRAELTRVGQACYTPTIGGDPFAAGRFRIRKNGVPLPPYENCFAAGTGNTQAGTLGTVGAIYLGIGYWINTGIPVSVHLVEGDTCQVDGGTDSSSSSALTIAVVAQGWMYPVRRDVDSIHGTVTN